MVLEQLDGELTEIGVLAFEQWVGLFIGDVAVGLEEGLVGLPDGVALLPDFQRVEDAEVADLVEGVVLGEFLGHLVVVWLDTANEVQVAGQQLVHEGVHFLLDLDAERLVLGTGGLLGEARGH